MELKKNIKVDIFVILLFVVILCGVCFSSELSSLDELWDFSNIFKMVNGFTIYNDLNVIITPLFFYIGEKV